MASANSSLRVSDLDFNSIRNNLKAYLNNQSEFSDYNFEGSGLSVLRSEEHTSELQSHHDRMPSSA